MSFLIKLKIEKIEIQRVGYSPFKIQDACEDFKLKCPTIYECLEVVTKTGTNPDRLYASAMILMNVLNAA